jgi:hypothetical protein
MATSNQHDRACQICLAALLSIALGPGRAAEAQATRPAEPYDPPQDICTLTDQRITEASGIVASRRTRGSYYIHNDSGDEPRVFLVDRSGATRLTIRLRGARHVDWEDIAVAPGEKPGTFDVCVADIGDNRARRKDLTIYRFPEVDSDAAKQPVVDVRATAYRISYADGPVDAEAFVVHPRTGDGYVLTKRPDGVCHVYKLAAPWNAEERTVLPKVATLRFPEMLPLQTIVTAADVSPDGLRLVTRSYLCGWERWLPRGIGSRGFERIFAIEPTQVELAIEPQGEAICYGADGRALLTVSEQLPTVLSESRSTASPDDHAP